MKQETPVKKVTPIKEMHISLETSIKATSVKKATPIKANFIQT